ncbi:sulfotransferase [Congregibacter brevis]|uniref:Sulfotransferase n=1 Tax=Congregibacter brevis TaxID=3081201 RepID=A0ABZ0IFI4_9GAMM|nr:sulfotransferase [Congregibacter sp. IMCC45268]
MDERSVSGDSGKGLKPNFIGIGAQRAASTWLNQCLRQHPEVCLPRKEIRFFNYGYEEGLDSYFRNFEGCEGCKIVGEITPDYYHSSLALDRMARDLPGIKLMYVVRNPIDRAYSQYKLYLDQGAIKSPSFESALEHHPELIEWSMQGSALRNVFERFDEKDVLVVLYDEILNAPSEVLLRIYNFLDIGCEFVPDVLKKRVNRVVLPRTQRVLKRVGMGALIGWVKKFPRLSEWIKDSFYSGAGASLKDETRQLLNAKFRDDVELLENLGGFDLRHWKV